MAGDEPHRGLLGSVGRWCATHARAVTCAWLLVVVAGALLLPKMYDSLSGSGMEGDGTESVLAREQIRKADPTAASSALSVVMTGARPYRQDPAFRQAARRVARTLAADTRVAGVLLPEQSQSVSPDGRTVILTAGAGRGTAAMIRAADALRDRVRRAAGRAHRAYLTGVSAQWADFNKNNHEATTRSEIVAAPVTLVVLVLAFGSLAAAGLPLLIALSGLAVSGGLLYLLTGLTHISIWSSTFAMIFTLALGLDYALFIVLRFREALYEGMEPLEAVTSTMDTAGRAVGFSAATVIVSLSTCFAIPSLVPRSIALGVVLSVLLVIAVTCSLLPVALHRLGPRIDAGSMPWRRAGRIGGGSSRMEAWGRLIWRRPWPIAVAACTLLVLLALPLAHLRIGIPGQAAQASDAPSRVGAERVARAFGPRATAPVTIVSPTEQLPAVRAAIAADPDLGPARRLPGSGPSALVSTSLSVPADSDAAGDQISRLRDRLPSGALVGGAPAELHDFRMSMQNSAPLIVGLILALGSALLLIAVQAPILALIGTLTSLLSTGAAFGITVLIFQDGHAAGLLGFAPQGFLDFWAPIFFFAMIFAVAMDYTIFFIASAREQWDRTADAETAVVQGMRRSGPVIVAAAAAMIAVYATFATSFALPAKEMGTILGLAVMLDAFVVRLTLLPALVRIAGARAWHQPRLLAKVLPSVSLSHGTATAHTATAESQPAVDTR